MIETTVDDVEVATPPPIAPGTPVDEAAGHLRRPGVSALVVRDGDAVAGIVTGSDVVGLVAETEDRPPVRAIMSTPVAAVTPTATVREAAARMRTNGVRRLAVVEAGAYRGVLSAGTLAPYVAPSDLEIEWRGEPVRVDGGTTQPTTGD
jgi:CBS domain-containing protein